MISALYQSLVDTLDTTDLSESQMIIHPRNIPQTELNRKYSLEIQTRNSGKYRDRTHIRTSSTVTCHFMVRINPHQQNASYKTALDLEEQVIGALMDQSDNPTVSILYTGTVRTLTASREYLLISVGFVVEGDLAITS